MPLLINNAIAEQALKMRDAIDAMESALKQYAEGYATFQPRTDLWSPTATVGHYYRWGSLLGALSDPPILAFRFKSDILLWQEAVYDKADLVVMTSNHALFDYVIGSPEDRNRRPMSAAYRRRYQVTNYTTLTEVVVGAKPGRTSASQMTFHHNLSAGIQFAAVGYLVYQYAKEHGLGMELPLEWFQQDIRN